jgi:hypothetical protein
MPAGSLNAALTRLFGPDAAFTANADVQVLDKDRQESVRMPMKFSVLGEKLRVDTDMTRMKSRELQPEVVAQFKREGMDRVSSVIRPDKKAMYLIYPAVKSYIEEPADPGGAALKIDKTQMGRETIDGHPSVKGRTVIKDERGAVVLDALVWYASDLKDFPVQIVTTENGNTTVMRFQQIQFSRPEEKLFDPPAGFDKFNSPQALRYAATQKNNSNAPAKKK